MIQVLGSWKWRVQRMKALLNQMTGSTIEYNTCLSNASKFGTNIHALDEASFSSFYIWTLAACHCISVISVRHNVHSARLFIFISVTPALTHCKAAGCWPGVRPGLYQAHVSLYIPRSARISASVSMFSDLARTAQRVEPGVGPDAATA